MIEAILLDVDGTLTNGRKEITPKTEAALRAAEAAGIRLVLASGRTDNGLSRFGRQLGMYEHDGVFVSTTAQRPWTARQERFSSTRP